MKRHPIGRWPTTWLICFVLGHTHPYWLTWPDGTERPGCLCCGKELVA